MKNKWLQIIVISVLILSFYVFFAKGIPGKILAATRRQINTGASESRASSQEIANYKKFKQLIKTLPVNQRAFYLTYSAKMDVVLVNLYAPDYDLGKTEFKNWASANGYGNLPREFFKFNLTNKTISNTTPSNTVPSVTPSPLAAPVQSFSLSPLADAYVKNSNPATNYGSAITLQSGLGPVSVIYFKFDLTRMKPTALKSALLKLSVCKSSNCSANGNYSVYISTDASWSESGVTFNRQPTGAQELLGSFTGAKLGQVISLNLNKAVMQKYSGKNATLIIKGSQANDNLMIYSKENSSGKPALIITN